MPWDLVGHKEAVGSLRNDLLAGRTAHAYLFTGADGIGKRTLALQFAQAINCTAPPAPGEPCGPAGGSWWIPRASLSGR
jgi:DNA polymerase III gamma/tau subunit